MPLELRTKRCSCQGKSETLGIPVNGEEIGYCYPVGDRESESPTRAKVSHQLGSEVHVQAGQPEYEAGRSKNPGRVLSPENGIVADSG